MCMRREYEHAYMYKSPLIGVQLSFINTKTHSSCKMFLLKFASLALKFIPLCQRYTAMTIYACRFLLTPSFLSKSVNLKKIDHLYKINIHKTSQYIQFIQKYNLFHSHKEFLFCKNVACISECNKSGIRNQLLSGLSEYFEYVYFFSINSYLKQWRKEV